MNTQATPRIVALFAAIAVTTLLAASQFGLADHYSGQADALLAQQPLAASMAQAPASQRQPG